MRSIFNHTFFRIFCLVIIFVQLGQILYFERSFILDQYDVSYWKDRVEHSQWQLPLSKRIVGDDGLFSYIGYQLIKGADPSGLNAETPPLGKYLIGLSIVVFGNPAFYALFFGLTTLFLFYPVANRFLSRTTSLFLVALLFFDPLFFTQLWKAWVDIPQLFFLLANMILFLWLLEASEQKKLLLAFASGLMLGFFTQTKPAILFPILFLMEASYLFFKHAKKDSLTFIAGTAGGIFIVYLPYFLQGYNLIDFFRFQKYVVSFYMSSQLSVHFDAIWQTLLLGKFPDIVTGAPSKVNEWWFPWSFAALLGIPTAFYVLLRKHELPFKGLSLFLLASLLIYTFIPSYPRYLLISIPFLYLFSGYAIEKFVHPHVRLIGGSLLLVYGMVNAVLFLSPTPDPLIKNFTYNFSHLYFHDIYQENLAKASRPLMTREEFRILTQRTFQDATVKAIEVKEKERNIPKFGNEGEVRLLITYKTQDLDSFSEEKIIHLLKENGQWKVIWDWDILLDKFRPDLTVETDIILGKRGRIIDDKGLIFAQDAPSYLVSVNPGKIDTRREGELLKFLESYNYKGAVSLQNAYLENSLPDEDIPLITFHTLISEKEKEELLSFPGVTLKEYPSRIFKGLDPNNIKNTFFEECCTRIYSSHNYHGIFGPEKAYDSTLSGYSGGTILIKDTEGKTVKLVLQKDVKNGQDIVIR